MQPASGLFKFVVLRVVKGFIQQSGVFLGGVEVGSVIFWAICQKLDRLLVYFLPLFHLTATTSKVVLGVILCFVIIFCLLDPRHCYLFPN